MVSQVREVFDNLAVSSQDVLAYIDENVREDYELLIQTGERYQKDAKLISGISEEVTLATKQMNHSLEKIEKVVSYVVCISEKNSDSTSEINGNLSEINIIMDGTYETAQQQMDIVKKLENSVEKFIL